MTRLVVVVIVGPVVKVEIVDVLLHPWSITTVVDVRENENFIYKRKIEISFVMDLTFQRNSRVLLCILIYECLNIELQSLNVLVS